MASTSQGLALLRRGFPRPTIKQLDSLLQSGQISCEQICMYAYSLAVVGENLWKLHAYAHLTDRKEVREVAVQADERRRQGRPLSILDGLPISVKANLAISTRPLTAGSRILGAGLTKQTNDDGSPAIPNVGYTAHVVKALLDDGGAVLIGQTNMDEFGMGSLGTHVVGVNGLGKDNPSYVPTRNPLPFLRHVRQTSHPPILANSELIDVLTLPEEAIWEVHDEIYRSMDTDALYSAGGSSCGSAVSVAHGSSILSLGSDTGGSVRLPAAWCGVVGLKPSYGVLSRHGLVSYASSLDTVGMLAPSAGCIQKAMQQVLSCQTKYARRDATITGDEIVLSSLSAASGNVASETTPDSLPLKGLIVGVPSAFSVQECPAAISQAWSSVATQLQSLGAEVEVTEIVSPSLVQKSLATYYVLASAEASSNLARYDGFRYGVAAEVDLWDEETNNLTVLERQYAATRTQGFGPEVQRRILCGTSVLSSDRFHTYYEAAAKLRARLTQEFHQALKKYDMLLFPTNIFPPVSLDREVDRTEMLANDVMTVPVSLAGLPAVSIPVTDEDGADDWFPFVPGLQLVGPRLGESKLLSTAVALEDRRSQ